MCLTLDPTHPLDLQPSGGLDEKLVEIVNHAATSLMISIGHRTRLFDIMAGLEPSSSVEIAEAAELDERYVREWLGSMTVSGLVIHDPVRKTYVLPEQHAAFLTRAGGLGNMAALMQFISVLGTVETDIVRCFHEGGGVPYSDFDRFHEVMAEDSSGVVDTLLLDQVLPLAPGLVERLEAGSEVLDVGCGFGKALVLLAERFPQSRFRGIDVCDVVIERARHSAVARGLENLTFEAVDAADLDAENAFDLVTAFDAIHDQAHPDRVLAAIRRALRPDGVFLMQDIAGSSHVEKNLEHPLAPFLYGVSCMHCMTVSLSAGGAGLGTMWGEELATQMLGDAGFEGLSLHHLEETPQHAYFVSHPAPSGELQ